MIVIKYKWLFFLLSGLLVAGSIVSLFKYGLNFGIDFKGGTIMELHYTDTRPEASQIESVLKPFNLGVVSVQPANTEDLILRFATITEDQHSAIVGMLMTTGSVTQTHYSSIGPSLGQELARKGLIALGLAVIFIIVYIAVAFRGVSRPVSSWKYGLIAIAALIHDVAIPTGVFSILATSTGWRLIHFF